MQRLIPLSLRLLGTTGRYNKVTSRTLTLPIGTSRFKALGSGALPQFPYADHILFTTLLERRRRLPVRDSFTCASLAVRFAQTPRVVNDPRPALC